MLCLILALLCCAVVGIINGVFTEIIGVSSFITTLGMLLGLGGLTLIISHAQPVAMPGAEVTSKTVNVTHVVNGQTVTLPEKVNEIGTFARIFGGGIYSELIWALHHRRRRPGAARRCTRWGMYTIAVGGNKHGAAEAGINVRIDRHPQLHRVQRLRRLRGRARGDAGELGRPRTPRAPRRRCSAPCRRR